jgi:FlaA1/EpsC-like NDP-sugar epimerase
VLGASQDLPKHAKATGARFAIIAVPSAPGDIIRTLLQRAREAGLETRIVPSLHEQIARTSGSPPVRQLRIEDLLQREPIVTDTAAVQALVTGVVVMVTGAGGSIGSELCRQLAAMAPSELVLVGRGENSVFEIQQELIGTHPSVKVTPVILDVRDTERMREIMKRHRPVAVFHAAAHKHVPLMEQNVLEALRNNVLGTKSVVDAALAADVPHLILISTDKAVRPTSVMGASKRIAEQVVQLAARESGKAYVSVRFGNVLGSRGSVVPTFLKQIAAGGPVMVTHPDMRRYFMTIPEAVQLVLQAFVMGEGEEVFCLDMGEPIRIVDLARDLIELTASPNGPAVEIRFAGVRPGEKLYEEMFFSAEHAEPTRHPKVLRSTRAELLIHTCAMTSELINELTGLLTGLPTEGELESVITDLVEDYRKDLAPSEPLRGSITV